MTISSIITFLTILFLLVVIHELGHFLFAKYFKMRVDEFAFGFPPALFKKKIGETTYSLNLIPLGGYVKIFGENGLDEEEKKNLSESEKKNLFGNHVWYKKILVLLGGVLFNVIGAIILFTFALVLGTSLSIDPSEIKDVSFVNRELVLANISPKSPLLETTISVGDKIISMQADGVGLSGEDIFSSSVSGFIQEHNNSKIDITFKNKGGKIETISVIPRGGIIEGKKIVGASFADIAFKKYGFFEAIVEATKITYHQLLFIFSSLYELVQDLLFKDTKVSDSVAGPIGLAMMTSKVSSKGLDQILIFAAMLSLSLAAFNILPIPALDGGRIFLVLAEVAMRKKIKASYEQLFHGLGFILLLCLMLFVTYYDIVKAMAS